MKFKMSDGSQYKVFRDMADILKDSIFLYDKENFLLMSVVSRSVFDYLRQNTTIFIKSPKTGTTLKFKRKNFLLNKKWGTPLSFKIDNGMCTGLKVFFYAIDDLKTWPELEVGKPFYL